MVRRGSTVRVRQRALQNPRKSGLSYPDRLAVDRACGGCGARCGAVRISGALRALSKDVKTASFSLQGRQRRLRASNERSRHCTSRRRGNSPRRMRHPRRGVHSCWQQHSRWPRTLQSPFPDPPEDSRQPTLSTPPTSGSSVTTPPGGSARRCTPMVGGESRHRERLSGYRGRCATLGTRPHTCVHRCHQWLRASEGSCSKPSSGCRRRGSPTGSRVRRNRQQQYLCVACLARTV
jgi:hypothetical protein